MQFTYRARKDAKSEASGLIEAIDLSSAVAQLTQSGLFPFEIVPLKPAAEKHLPERSDRSLSRLELVLWGRTIGQGLRAGLTLTQSLHLLGQQEKGRFLGSVTNTLERQVTAGMSLADAMQTLGMTFSPIAVGLVRAGGISGALEQVTLSLADQAEAEAELIGKVRGALVYPLFILLVGFGTVAVLLWVVVPKLAALFTETGQPLPVLTRWMIQWGRISVVGFFAAAVAAAVGWLVLRARGGSRRFLDGLGALFTRLPVFGRLTAHAEIARLSSLLALMISQGLPLPEALRLCSDTMARARLREQIRQVERDIVEGVDLSAALRRSGFSDAFLLTLVAMGEAQGDLAQSFRQAAARYQSEVDRAVKVLSTLIEPAMILVVGVLVGAIVFAMLLPIFQINFAVG